MNLYELQKEYNYKKISKEYAERKITYLRNSLEPQSTKIKEDVVSGSRLNKDIADTMYEIIQLESEIKMYDEELELYAPVLEELEKLFNEYNDIYKKIYFDYYIKKYSADKIGLKHCYSRAQVYNIINKIDEELQSETLDEIRQVTL